MPIRNLGRILAPRRVAVVGASSRPASVGGRVLSDLLGSGFPGVFYPVNPGHEAVQGVAAYPNVAALPHRADLAILCTPAATIPGLVRECGEAGIEGLVILSAGFREAGAAGRALEARIASERARFPGMRILGPNCLGLLLPHLGLNATFARGMPPKGHVAFVSQSGALCAAMLDWAIDAQVGISCFVSIGNMIDVDFADLIDWLALDPKTEQLILYVEAIERSRAFLSAARAFSRKKPLVAYKAGRFESSARAAASHTGALAGNDAVYEAAFRRAGIERVEDLSDLFDCAELLARHRRPTGRRLAILTNAGGPGVTACDALLARQGELAPLSPGTLAALDAILPAAWSRQNPVDILGDADPARLARAAGVLLAEPAADALLVVLAPQAMTDPAECARAVISSARQSPKPVLAVWMGGASMSGGLRLLQQAGLPTFGFPEPAVRAFLHLASYERNLEILSETPRELPATPSPEPPPLTRSGSWGATETKRLLSAYGIPVVQAVVATGAEEAARVVASMEGRVAMKILSADILHKSDVNGVMLDVEGGAGARDAFARLLANAARHAPSARIDGVTIEPMVRRDDGTEMILGIKRDPVFGSVLLAGAGGVTAELQADHALELPPLTERLARRMIESLRLLPLLRGYRGRPRADLDALLGALLALSRIAEQHAEIAELDINPLLVGPAGVVALDARAAVSAPPERFGSAAGGEPGAHLAIRPCPMGLDTEATLSDGRTVRLRPIRPEDEPLWHEMVGACSEQSLRQRFQSLFRKTTHAMAAPYLFLDYDREVALVAEIAVDGRRSLIGVGRLASDADRREAEYAALVPDAWQGLGLGTTLTRACLEVARQWGLRRVHATTGADNHRMLRIFRELGFRLEQEPGSSTVEVERMLSGCA